jgi:hypothetical protein
VHLTLETGTLFPFKKRDWLLCLIGVRTTATAHLQNTKEHNNNALLLHRQFTWWLLCTPEQRSLTV